MDTARLELPATPAAASVARLFVRCLCEEWGVGAVADVAELLSSELVTNAVVHARSAIELEAAWTSSDLRVDVRDVGGGEVADEHATRRRPRRRAAAVWPSSPRSPTPGASRTPVGASRCGSPWSPRSTSTTPKLPARR